MPVMRKWMEELEVLVDEQDRKAEASAVLAEYARCAKEYVRCKRSLKTAFVSNTVKAAEGERAVLLEGADVTKQKQKVCLSACHLVGCRLA
jgi:hypothetical protein